MATSTNFSAVQLEFVPQVCPSQVLLAGQTIYAMMLCFADAQARFVRSALWHCGYRARWVVAPQAGGCCGDGVGSRELLLALGWMLSSGSLLEFLLGERVLQMQPLALPPAQVRGWPCVPGCPHCSGWHCAPYSWGIQVQCGIEPKTGFFSPSRNSPLGKQILFFVALPIPLRPDQRGKQREAALAIGKALV